MKLFILLLTKVLFMIRSITGLSQTFDGICHSGDLSYILCCRHFEFVDNRCIECEAGYHTYKVGTKCESCPKNLYGKKCAFTCNCKENDRCDNINGTCIQRSTSTVTLSEHLTSSEYQSQSTTEQNVRGFSSKQAKYIAVATTNYPGPILVYMICAGLTILVLCAVAAVNKYQNKLQNVPKSVPKQGIIDSTPPPIIARSMQPSVFIEFDNSGGAYELIDDNNILNLGN